MATFRASSVSLASAYASIKTTALQVRDFCNQQITPMQQAQCSANVPLVCIRVLTTNLAILDVAAAAPGLGAYAQQQEGDATYDVVAAYNSMRSTIQSARDMIVSMFPKDANGHLLYQIIDGSNAIVSDSFTAAQLAPVVTALQNVVATIA